MHLNQIDKWNKQDRGRKIKKKYKSTIVSLPVKGCIINGSFQGSKAFTILNCIQLVKKTKLYPSHVFKIPRTQIFILNTYIIGKSRQGNA